MVYFIYNVCICYMSYIYYVYVYNICNKIRIHSLILLNHFSIQSLYINVSPHDIVL